VTSGRAATTASSTIEIECGRPSRASWAVTKRSAKSIFCCTSWSLHSYNKRLLPDCASARKRGINSRWSRHKTQGDYHALALLNMCLRRRPVLLGAGRGGARVCKWIAQLRSHPGLLPRRIPVSARERLQPESSRPAGSAMWQASLQGRGNLHPAGGPIAVPLAARWAAASGGLPRRSTVRFEPRAFSGEVCSGSP
jgi:hypothetical protein